MSRDHVFVRYSVDYRARALREHDVSETRRL